MPSDLPKCYETAVRAPQIFEAGFLILAAVAVYQFVRTGIDGEQRRVCSSLCGMAPQYAGRNRIAPDFELPALAGGRLRLSDHRGKVVILNFWTKTCPPCLEEMNSLAELGRSLRGRKDIVLWTISTDQSFEDIRVTLRSVLGEAEPPFTVLLDPEADVVTGKFGTKLFPETWYIDRDQVIRARVDGARDWSGPLALDFAESLGEPLVCEVIFRQGRPSGKDARFCRERLGG